MEFGARIARPFLPWLVPELELAISPTSTAPAGGVHGDGVFWFEPRIHLRLELWQGLRNQPFARDRRQATPGRAVVGRPSGSAPRSSATATSAVGVRLDTFKGFVLRFDARLAILPSQPTASFGATTELDIGFGIEFRTGDRRRPLVSPEEARLAEGPPPPDRDGRRHPRRQGRLPRIRPEDIDGFEDADGCPDIDNDLDRVLEHRRQMPQRPRDLQRLRGRRRLPPTPFPPDVDALRGHHRRP